MAENTYKSNTFKKPEKERKGKGSKSQGKFNFAFFKDPRFKLAFGFFLIISAVYLFTAFVSYLFTGKADQSVIQSLLETQVLDSGKETENWLGLGGAITSYFMIFRWMGISGFLVPPLMFLLGFRMAFQRELVPIYSAFVLFLFSGLWLCLLLGYLTHSIAGANEISYLSGGLGFELARIADGLLGWGTFLFLMLSLFIFIIYYFNITAINAFQVRNPKPMGNDALLPDDDQSGSAYTDESDNWPLKNDILVPEPVLANNPVVDLTMPEKLSEKVKDPATEAEPRKEKPARKAEEPKFTVEETKEEAEVIADQLVLEKGFYDPTLDLGTYRFPPLELLNEYDTGKVQVTQDELNQNKDKIIATLENFKISIQSIKATIGPTVTLYEIVPDAGIKISRIKNLEDDIALSLAALGIRIIAPIPGKGTIGIEVPNKNREMVGIRSVLSTEKFQKTDKELPIAIGKTISNEVLVIDLAKMPHLLVAGATGQGKSVGLNVILTSLLYKKHPAQLKFVLVDPKKVEMSLFSKIERHYLAKLPNSEEAIITDTRKVVHTLNSLCIEMENRYEILKDAGAKNVKE